MTIELDPPVEQPALIEKRKRGRPFGSTKKPPKRGRPQKTMRDSAQEKTVRILELKESSALTRTEIADAVGVSPATVDRVLKRFKNIRQELKELPELRSVQKDLIDASLFKAIKSLNDDEKHEKASLNNVAYAFQQLYNASRLEHGRSTSNINQKICKFSGPAINPDKDDE